MEPRRRLKPLFWTGSSRKDLKSFPAEVQDEMGYALRDAQFGGQRMNVQVLKGFRGAGVFDVIENFDGNTFRAVYTVRFEGVVYVLHAFQKKSKRGIATPQADLKLIRARPKAAEEHYLKWRARI
ncbi:MAG: type II toxin-antitoxin system RelE/ParE family toxin [Betaproteobacteria bacterium]|nr:type II toxin-antitoxin system RelE/ParE family toxin [Betaproteobacteria bacterium]